MMSEIFIVEKRNLMAYFLFFLLLMNVVDFMTVSIKLTLNVLQN